MEQEALRRFKEEMARQFDLVRKPETDQVTVEELMLPATETVRLRTILFRPEGAEEPLPTVVIRSCYPMQEEMLTAQLREYARRGFAGVLQWCRGTGGSEGDWEPYFYEREDGIALMQWLEEQPWCKNIGMMGASYLALTGWEIADALPEKVKTMYLTVLGTEWHTSLWDAGSFRQDVYTSWLMGETTHDYTLDYMQTATYRPQVRVDEALWHKRSQVYRDFITHPSPADPYWNEGFWGVLRGIPAKMKIPVFIGEGWYDIHLQNMLDTYTRLSEESRRHTVVQVNPGNHNRSPVIPGQKTQEHAAIREFEQQMRWFEEILKNDRLPEPGVDFYLIGADEWRRFSSYPVPVSEWRPFYLDGEALKPVPGGEGVREYDYDPNDPVPSYGSGTLFRNAAGVGSLRQPERNYRPDVLSYQSEPLAEDMDIIGRIKAELYIQSDAPDTCFTFKLMEVMEDGSAWNIRDGITTLGYPSGAAERQHYSGEPIRITIDSWEVAYRVKKGSCLRVDISSSNFPEFSVHPNTETIWSEETEVRSAHQKVFSGGERPSRLLLPLCPANEKE